MNYQSKFETGLSYADFLQKHGTVDQQNRWGAALGAVQLSETQIELLKSFQREMKIMVLAGAWCGDCVNQCPIFERFAVENSKIQIHYFDRDEHPDLGEELKTCGAYRVPSVLFLSEDWFVCGRYGDKTLAKYRELAEKQLGGTCPTGIGGIDQEMLNTVTAEWLNEFERIQWMLRLSGRLREKHGD
jgi:hypothetical protein